MIRRPAPTRRAGSATVEAAIVMSVFLLFLFGIFEYCRYLMMIEVTTNAARDGARYAVVNVDKGSTFDVTDYSASVPSITKYVNNKMAGVNAMIDSYTVTVFACDSDKLALTPPQAVAKSGSTWNQAQFGERIAVKITGNYRTILPSFLLMDAVFPVNVAVTMGSEG